MTPHEFVLRWRNNTATERQSYQQFFLDLCALVQHPTPRELDPDGKFFTFEAGAAKSGGGQGWADVWFSGHFAIEFKGPEGNLDRAYTQLLQYRESLGNPPLLVVSDTQQLLIHTNFTNSVKQITTLALADLESAAGLQALRNLFFHPEAFRPERTAAQVTEEAAAEFARLADHLRARGHAPHEIAHYLIRLLFCLFAEDIELLPRELFSRMVENGRRAPAHFNRQVVQLFHAMAEGDTFGEHAIRYFNGGLFDEAAVLEMDADALALLHAVTRLDWSAIEPSILGTLFTRSLDPSKRAQLGAHYTSSDDILLIVEPVLMAPLRRRWALVQEQARALAARRETAPTRAVATRTHNELNELVIGFVQQARSVRVLDPACGSGNFLYISLRLLLDLEKEVIHFCGEVAVQPFFPLVGPTQLFGIEKDEYAHELAQATVWIGYLQWLHENGYGVPGEPILKPLDNIRQMDAILAHDAAGRPVEPAWQEAEVIVGNPPFLGNKSMRDELGGTYVEDLRKLYEGRLSGSVDLVIYWFERARAQIERGLCARAGLLATQAIRFGTNRNVLERIKESGDIFYAQADRPWVLGDAAVRVSMIGFDDGSEKERWLNTQTTGTSRWALTQARQVTRIHASLTSDIDVFAAMPLAENMGLCFQGPVKVGSFELPAETGNTMRELPNPSGLSNHDVIKPWMNGNDVTGRARHMWIIDFGERSEAEAAKYEAPFTHVTTLVRPERENNNDRQRRVYWWRLGRSGADLKSAKAGLSRIVVTSRVSKHRVLIWADGDLVPDARLYAFARDDDYFFGVLHSRPHEVWSLATSSRHGVGNDPTYNSQSCFETYPFPWPPGREPQDDPHVQAIAAAARALVRWRDGWLNPPGLAPAELKKRTLTALYNARPPELAALHAALDAAVFAAYGWPASLSEQEMLERLLALNAARAA